MDRSSRLHGFVLVALFALPSGVSAQDGWYFRMELGAALTPGMTVHGSDDDWSTKCDLLSNPAQVETDPANCASAPPRAEWYSDVDGGAGTLAGLVLGYALNRLRVEVASYRVFAGLDCDMNDGRARSGLQHEMESLIGIRRNQQVNPRRLVRP